MKQEDMVLLKEMLYAHEDLIGYMHDLTVQPDSETEKVLFEALALSKAVTDKARQHWGIA